MTPRYLIVNADDFGQSPGVNRGVVEAFERGIVTSASLMVRWPAAAQAAAYAAGHPRLGLGLHLDLGEWMYDAGDWRPVYAVVDLSDADAVAAEVARQVAEFRRLSGRQPDHIDSHQHVHREAPVRDVVLEAAERIGVPVRDESPAATYVGGFYGQTAEGDSYPEGITAENLLALIREAGPGATEIGCHPGYDDGLSTMYRAERAIEVRTLTDAAVAAAVASTGAVLCSFADLANCLPTKPPAPSLSGTKE